MRIHPAIIAHAAATAADLMPGRFFLGVGTGENLNEHILGQAWPEWDVRAEMLEESVEVIRRCGAARSISHRGRHYRVQNARSIHAAGDAAHRSVSRPAAPRMAEMAARIGDGLIATAPDREARRRVREGRRGRARGSAS